jgi:hypothetical protein
MGSFSTFVDNSLRMQRMHTEDLIPQVPVSVAFVDRPSTELIKSPPAYLPGVPPSLSPR